MDTHDYTTPVTRQTDGPIESLPLDASNRQARELARMVQEGILTLDAPYQRPSVWGLEQRVNLVRSWLSRTPIPAVILNDRARSSWQDDDNYLTGRGVIMACVDGKQRIETAIAWFNSEFAVPASWFPADYVAETVETADGPYVYFNGLIEAEQRGFAFSASIPVATGHMNSTAEEAALYVRLNTGGIDQTDADIDNARSIAAR